MSLRTVGRQLVDMCNHGKNFDVMETLYAPDIVSVEGAGEETIGQASVIQKSRRWQDENVISRQEVRGPYYHGGDQFAVHFTFDVTRKKNGEHLTLEEVGVYTLKGEKIVREQFFYDGEH